MSCFQRSTGWADHRARNWRHVDFSLVEETRRGEENPDESTKDRELCVGVKNRVPIAPEFFEMDEYVLARVIKANVAGQGESASAPRRGQTNLYS